MGTLKIEKDSSESAKAKRPMPLPVERALAKLGQGIGLARRRILVHGASHGKGKREHALALHCPSDACIPGAAEACEPAGHTKRRDRTQPDGRAVAAAHTCQQIQASPGGDVTGPLNVKETVSVCIGEADRDVGMLVYAKQGARESTSFAYSERWLAWAERFRVSPELELISAYQSRKAPSKIDSPLPFAAARRR